MNSRQVFKKKKNLMKLNTFINAVLILLMQAVQVAESNLCKPLVPCTAKLTTRGRSSTKPVSCATVLICKGHGDWRGEPNDRWAHHCGASPCKGFGVDQSCQSRNQSALLPWLTRLHFVAELHTLWIEMPILIGNTAQLKVFAWS